MPKKKRIVICVLTLIAQSLDELRAEVAGLRADVRDLARRLDAQDRPA